MNGVGMFSAAILLALAVGHMVLGATKNNEAFCAIGAGCGVMAFFVWIASLPPTH